MFTFVYVITCQQPGIDEAIVADLQREVGFLVERARPASQQIAACNRLVANGQTGKRLIVGKSIGADKDVALKSAGVAAIGIPVGAKADSPLLPVVRSLRV